MPHDPVRVAEVHGWLSKAAEDLRAAQVGLAAEPPLFDDAVFHCQQTAEKVLKGFLLWHDVPFRKTHNLEELGEQCLQIDSGLRALIDRAVPLTEYAWRFRYPGEQAHVEPDEAAEARAVAGELYEAIAARLPSEARP
jgi:HEPN domain-containing protein